VRAAQPTGRNPPWRRNARLRPFCRRLGLPCVAIEECQWPCSDICTTTPFWCSRGRTRWLAPAALPGSAATLSPGAADLPAARVPGGHHLTIRDRARRPNGPAGGSRARRTSLRMCRRRHHRDAYEQDPQRNRTHRCPPHCWRTEPQVWRPINPHTRAERPAGSPTIIRPLPCVRAQGITATPYILPDRVAPSTIPRKGRRCLSALWPSVRISVVANGAARDLLAASRTHPNRADARSLRRCAGE
jgi:hypothetical protein